MKIQFDWLKQYVDPGIPVAELGHLLTMAGLEIESHETVTLSDGRTDDVLELNVTPNRGYCLSHIGVAREVAALTGNPLRLPDIQSPQPGTPDEILRSRLTVHNDAPELCPRYAALVIENVAIGPSPQWLVDRLTAIGLRPINNAVDITNFVLMEYGQPLHAFDLDLLQNKQIIVRMANSGETFDALDGTQLKLDADALVIADAVRPVALAGIMGGSNSQVTESTTTIALESACFDAVSVRKSSKKYALRSDSSYRFERGVDIEAVLTAQHRAALLIQELAGGQILEGQIDLYPHPKPKTTVEFRVSRCNDVLGTRLDAATMVRYLEGLAIQMKEVEPGQKYLATLPCSRPNLTREIDLIEEVARLNGYDKIEVSAPLGRMRPVHFTPLQKAVRETRTQLQADGFMEAVNYSFIESSHAERFLPAFAPDDAKTIPLDNPISSDLGTMRTSLLPGLLKSAVRNIHRGEKSLRLFEQGQVFFLKGDGERVERTCLAALMTGPYPPNVWKPTGKTYDYYDIKGTLDTILQQLKMQAEMQTSALPFLLPGPSVDLNIKGKTIGFMGQIHPEVAGTLDLDQEAFVLELDLALVAECRPREIRFEPLPRYPGTYRDISIVVRKSVSSREAGKVIQETGAPLLRQVDLYDQFEGKKLDAGQKSLTFALTFQDPDKTLTDDEVNPVFDRIVGALSDRLQARLRD